MTENDFRDAVASRIATDGSVELDDTDYQLMALLRKDGRTPYRALALAVGLTEATVRARVRRLEDSDIMRVVAVTDYEAAGYTMMLAIGLQVEGRPADEVARELAGFAEVFHACQVVGKVDIEILVVVRDQPMLNELLSVKLARVKGVSRLFPAMAMDVLKNQPNWVPFAGSPLISGDLDE
jgi:Lrp/AsnC family transcriptional regulator for asnA, asnC and gidA